MNEPDQNPTLDSSSNSTPHSVITIGEFARIELRIGRIIAAEAIPKSKKLLKLQVDLGETLKTRQILAGIAKSYEPESLIERCIVVVSNLATAHLMGYESQGMVIASSRQDGRVVLVDPGQDAEPGTLVR